MYTPLLTTTGNNGAVFSVRIEHQLFSSGRSLQSIKTLAHRPQPGATHRVHQSSIRGTYKLAQKFF